MASARERGLVLLGRDREPLLPSPLVTQNPRSQVVLEMGLVQNWKPLTCHGLLRQNMEKVQRALNEEGKKTLVPLTLGVHIQDSLVAEVGVIPEFLSRMRVR